MPLEWLWVQFLLYNTRCHSPVLVHRYKAQKTSASMNPHNIKPWCRNALVDILTLSRVRKKVRHEYKGLQRAERGNERMSTDHHCCQRVENIYIFCLSHWAGVFAVVSAWRECGMERVVTAPVCVCVWAMKRVTKRGRWRSISMPWVSALNVPLSPSLSLILSLTHQSLSPQCPWQLYHQNTPAKEDNCNLSTAERLRARVRENVCVGDHVFSCLWYSCVDESVSRCIILYSWGSPLRGESHLGQRSKNLFAVLRGQGQSMEDTCTRSLF